MTVSEVALTESPSLRAQYADRIDVLDKIKALQLLADGDHASIELVARYYEVPIETIKSVVKNNRAELADNGLRIVTGQELRSLVDLSRLDVRTPSLTLFTRRTILCVGMALRDSAVARAVRDYLLDTEEEAVATEVHVPLSLPEALRAYANELEAHERTKELLAEARPLAEAYRDLMSKDGTFDWAATAQIFSRLTGGLGRNRFLELLRDLGILKANNTPYQRFMKHFKVVGDSGGPNAVPTTTVKPEGLDWLRSRLITHFFEQGSLFAIQGGAA